MKKMSWLTIGYDVTILGKPLVLYLGIIIYSLVFLQVFIAFSNLKLRKQWIPFSVHRKLGYVALAMATIHATLVAMVWFLAPLLGG
ncbi:MAG: hypothetical protein PHF51_00615 [Candidatus ainarchaeum sp.]|nr:hypothetical protein [Candidatus ainarchaeum sp.]